MTIKVGTEYIHMALGYQDEQGAIVITEDTELATMTGRYVDQSPHRLHGPGCLYLDRAGRSGRSR